MTIKVGDLVSYGDSLIGLIIKTDFENDWCLIHWFVAAKYTKTPGEFSIYEITHSSMWKKLNGL